MDPAGYTADAERQTVSDPGWSAGECARSSAPIAGYGQGVVTPHASFLALDFAPAAALRNLAALRRDFPSLYGLGGFKDSVNVATGEVADRYLALDQGMILAALANELSADRLQGYLARVLQPRLEPLMALEEFGAGPIRRANGPTPAKRSRRSHGR